MLALVECGNPECATLFVVKSKIHTFCSTKCRKAARGKDWKKTRASVLRRDCDTCQDCGHNRGRLEVHHIKPVCIGGTNEASNLITLCATCHKAVHHSWGLFADWDTKQAQTWLAIAGKEI